MPVPELSGKPSSHLLVADLGQSTGESFREQPAGGAELREIKEQLKSLKERFDKGEKWSKQGIMGKQTQDAKIDLLNQKFLELVQRLSYNEKQVAVGSALGKQVESILQAIKQMQIKFD